MSEARLRIYKNFRPGLGAVISEGTLGVTR